MAPKMSAMRGFGGERGKRDTGGEDCAKGGKQTDDEKDRNNKGERWCRKCQAWRCHNTDGCLRGGLVELRLKDSMEDNATQVDYGTLKLESQFQSTPATTLSNTTRSNWQDLQNESQTLYLLAPVAPPPSAANVSEGTPVDTRVTNALALTRIESQNHGVELCIHCSRPNFGSGQKIWILTNHFAVSLPKINLHTYTLQGIPQTMKGGNKQRLVRELLATWPLFNSQRGHWATDHASLVVASCELSTAAGGAMLQPGESVDGPQIQYSTADSRNSHQLHITLRYNGILDFSPYNSFMEGKDPNINLAQLTQVLNVIMAKHANTPDHNGHKDLLEVGTNRFFYKAGWTSLTAGLVAYRGYFSSVRPGMSQVLLNVNKLTTAFFKPAFLHEFIRDWFNIGAARTLHDHEIRELNRILRGVKVRIVYDRSSMIGADIDSESRRTKLVIGIGKPLETQIFTKDGQEVLVRDYLRTAYGHYSKFEQLPCINVGGRQVGKEVWLPAEKLWILPHQLFRGNLEGQHADNMINEACKTPQQNASAIGTEGLRLLGVSPPSEVLQSFGIHIDDAFLKLPARCLTPPRVLYGWEEEPYCTSRSTWNLREVGFYEPRTLPVLDVLNVHEDGKHSYDAGPLSEVFRALLVNYGPSPETTQLHKLPLPRKTTTTYMEELKRKLREVFEKMEIFSVVFILLPVSDSWLYTTIKRIADLEFGIGTVCAQIAKIQKITRFGEISLENGELVGFLANLAMKVNLKLGGTNHILPPKRFGKKVLDKGKPCMMIIGADVTHPAPQSTPGTPSIAAVVANVDAHFSKYPGSMRLQTPKQEVISELGAMVYERLKVWLEWGNAQLPRSILLYRDGVSESQYATMCLQEIPQIEKACEDVGLFYDKQHNPFGKKRYRPAITYVVVSKRHHTRFYPIVPDENRDENKGNTMPGTIVDSEITNTYDFDFYLQAHSVTKGQARPAHYYVLRNENEFHANELQVLTFDLSYIYARSTSSVSYAAPAYYAHHLCTRGRNYLKELFDGTRREPVTVESVLAEDGLWSNPQASGSNPWHQNLDDVMFYL